MSSKQSFRKTIRGWISFSSSSHIDYSPSHLSSGANPPVPTSPANSSRKDMDRTDGTGSPPPRPSVPIPENETYALSSLDIHCALSLSELTKEIATIPTIGSLVGCLKHVFQAIDRSKVNKGQWKLLRGRCVMVLRIAGAHVENYGQGGYPNLEEAAALLQNTLNRVEERAQHYNEMDELLALVLSQSISDEIRILFADLDGCLRLFNFTVEVAHEQWSGQYQSIRRRESSELWRLRVELEKMNINFDTLRQNPDESSQKTHNTCTPQQALDGKYTIFQNQATITVASYVDAQHLVHTILSVTGLQLPPKVIIGKQCILDAPTPIKTGITCDIYQASFLRGEKVTKESGIEISDKDYMETRFLRIASLWSESGSDFNFPFCGMGVRLNSLGGESHFQLYTASPLIKSFEVQNKDDRSMKKNILRTITDTAKGLRYLHDRRPPITHSGIRRNNILVTNSEGGILGGFGLTKALESVGNGKPSPAVMSGKSDSQGWMAPKISMNDAPLETMCDVWGWATMAALKIVNSSIPFHAHKQAIAVIIQIGEGPPRREHHPRFEEYAYRPDEMWELLQKCWAIEQSNRPTIDEIILRLKDIAKMPEVGV